MKTWITALVAVFALTTPTWAQTAEDGSPLSIEDAFHAIQTAVGDDDAETVAAWIAYPFKTIVDGEEYVFGGPEGVIDHYESMMTVEIKTAVAEQTFEDLFSNYQGSMFGNGQMWISEICRADDCAVADFRIIAIQSTVR